MSSLDFLGELPEVLPKEELDSLFCQMKMGNKKAREKIILHNLKLVIYEINNKFSQTVYEKDELIDIGIIGLIKSVDAFDLDYNKSFSSLAVKCIDNEILWFLRKNKKHINNISLEIPIKNNNYKSECQGKESNLKDFLSDPTADLFVSKFEDQELISMFFNKLNEREKYIITKYYGFNNNKPMTQQEIGKELGVTQTSIQKTIKKVLQRTRRRLNIKENLVKKELINKKGGYYE